MRRLTVSAFVLGALAAHAPTAAQAEQPAVFRFPAPPAGFRPDKASDADLATYGLPARPSPFIHTTMPYAAWARGMAAARKYVVPEVRLTGRRHRASVEAASMVPHRNGPYYSYNWAGQVITNGATSFGGSSFAEALGQWVVSAVQQAIGTCNSVDVSSIWVGMDGFINKDVAQAGTESDVYCSGGNQAPDYYAWFEWAPNDEYEITNYPVYPGAPIFVVVQATSATSAVATFVNLESNAYTTVGFAPPAGTYFVGSSAEWVVERPQLGKAAVTASNLTDYGMIWLSSEVVFPYGDVGTGNYDVPGAPGAGHVPYTLTMVDTNGSPLAQSAPQGASAQDVDVLGSAY